MELFLHNYIADMRGPTFLGYYFVFLIVVVILRSVIVSVARLITPSPRVPKDMDPYKFAYLRGGDQELLGAVQFSLYQRGYLALAHGSSSMIVAPDYPDDYHLRPVEQSVFEGYQSGKFSSSDGTKYVERYGRQYEAELEEQGLLASGMDTVKSIHYLSVALFGGLGVYKFTVAMMKGYTNVLFLVMLTIGGVIALLVSGPKTRTTLKGEKYLKELRKALEGYRSQLAQRSTNLTTEERTLAEPKATLIMAVFGAGALLATAYGDLFASAAPAASSLASSNSSFFSGISISSCSSCSSSSCSSCSSCGGCGGGGCGGCGA